VQLVGNAVEPGALLRIVQIEDVLRIDSYFADDCAGGLELGEGGNGANGARA
jgi:hypothetical protein